MMITQGQEDGSERWNWHGLRRGWSVRRGDGGTSQLDISYINLSIVKTFFCPGWVPDQGRGNNHPRLDKRIQDESEHSFDQWIYLKLAIRCSSVMNLILSLSESLRMDKCIWILDPNWPIIFIAKFSFSNDFYWSIDICMASWPG